MTTTLNQTLSAYRNFILEYKPNGAGQYVAVARRYLLGEDESKTEFLHRFKAWQSIYQKKDHENAVLPLDLAFDTFKKYQLAAGKDEKTLSAYADYYSSFKKYLGPLGVSDVGEISKELIEEYRAHLAKITKKGKHLTMHVQHRRLLFVRYFFEILFTSGVIQGNPARKVILPKVPRLISQNYLNEKDMKKLLRMLPSRNPRGKRTKVMAFLAFFYGLRASEVRSIKVNDVDLDSDILYIQLSKNKKSRCLPLLEPAKQILSKYISSQRQGLFIDSSVANINPYLFPPKDKEGRLSLHMVNKSFNESVKRSGFFELQKQKGNKEVVNRNLTFHCLRYSFATAMLKNGMGLRHLQKILGHSNIDSTAKYTKVLTDELMMVVNNFHPSTREKDE